MLTRNGEARSVSFIIPVLNAEDLLPECLGSIRAQDYPADRVEILVMDGGSTDGTRAVAGSFGAVVVDNPARLAEPGVALGQQRATGELQVVMAADNALPASGWLRSMTACFDEPEVVGSFTHVVNSASDPAFGRYYNLMHADPFNWFVYGAAVDPRMFRRRFRSDRRDGYDVYGFEGADRPLLALAQGFTIRSSFVRQADSVNDDILPIWDLLDQGARLAYVPQAGIHHHSMESFRHFVRKFRVSIRRNLDAGRAGSMARRKLMSRSQRRRQYLWFAYSLSVVGPVVDAVRGWRQDGDPSWLYHAIACPALTLIMISELTREGLRRASHLVRPRTGLDRGTIRA